MTAPRFTLDETIQERIKEQDIRKARYVIGVHLLDTNLSGNYLAGIVDIAVYSKGAQVASLNIRPINLDKTNSFYERVGSFARNTLDRQAPFSEDRKKQTALIVTAEGDIPLAIVERTRANLESELKRKGIIQEKN